MCIAMLYEDMCQACAALVENLSSRQFPRPYPAGRDSFHARTQQVEIVSTPVPSRSVPRAARHHRKPGFKKNKILAQNCPFGHQPRSVGHRFGSAVSLPAPTIGRLRSPAIWVGRSKAPNPVPSRRSSWGLSTSLGAPSIGPPKSRRPFALSADLRLRHISYDILVIITY